MSSSKLLRLALVAALAVPPATRASADGGDFVAGAIIGAIGAAAASQNKRRTTVTRSTVSRPRLPSTQEGREIQTSLNYFGFDAGGVDGQLGRRSREAISRYQAYMGYPATGELTTFEQTLLVTSYNRAQAGGASVTQVIASNPDGTRGLLKSVRAEMAGGTQPATQMAAAPMTTVVVNPAAPAAAAPTAVPQVTSVVTPAAPAAPTAAPETTMAAAEKPALPNFMGRDEGVSLASHCNKVSLLTNTNGGFVTEASMGDPDVALAEQFCLARTYAIAQGEEMVARIQGVTPSQVAAQCESFGPVMADYVSSLSLKPMGEVTKDVAGFVLESGMAPAEMAGTAKICLSVGYRTDDMDVAIGSALLLVTLGERVYGELLGHHISQGFGASKRADLALAWYETGLDAVEAGAAPVFAPGQPDRQALIRKAAFSMKGAGAGQAQDAAVVPAGASALPSFTVKE